MQVVPGNYAQRLVPDIKLARDNFLLYVVKVAVEVIFIADLNEFLVNL